MAYEPHCRILASACKVWETPDFLRFSFTHGRYQVSYYNVIEISRHLKLITPTYYYGIYYHGNKLAPSKVMRLLSHRWNSHILGNIYCLCLVTELGVSSRRERKRTQVRIFFSVLNWIPLSDLTCSS